MITTVSLFCGAGGEQAGKSIALQQAGYQRVRSIAVNHWDVAIAVHLENFPNVEAHIEDLTELRADHLGLRRIEVVWASPACTHHSRARGGAPCDAQLRAHATEVLDRWLRVADVRVFLLENVPEFEHWGPLGPDGRPDVAQRGALFEDFVEQLRGLGYQVEWRVLTAADYGDPTIRRRLFLQATKDGSISWPESTHANPLSTTKSTLPPWRSAYECVDWSVPMRSMFDTKRVLADTTMLRVAHGVLRYVANGDPFLVNLTHGVRLESLREPMRTVTGANRGEKALVTAVLQKVSPSPVPTNTPGSLVPGDVRSAAFMVNLRGTSAIQLEVSSQAITRPLHSISAGGGHHLLVVAMLQRFLPQSVIAQEGPLVWCTTTDGEPVVCVWLDGELWAIVDILKRMLTVRELARAMGFPDSFQFTSHLRHITATDAIKLIGNACPVNTTAAIVSNALSYLNNQ